MNMRYILIVLVLLTLTLTACSSKTATNPEPVQNVEPDVSAGLPPEPATAGIPPVDELPEVETDELENTLGGLDELDDW